MLERDSAIKYDPAKVDGLRLRPKTEVGRQIAAQVAFLQDVFGDPNRAAEAALQYTPDARLAALRDPESGQVITFGTAEELDEVLSVLGEGIDPQKVEKLQVFAMED